MPYFMDSSIMVPSLTDVSLQPRKSCSLHKSSISSWSTSFWPRSDWNKTKSMKIYTETRLVFSWYMLKPHRKSTWAKAGLNQEEFSSLTCQLSECMLGGVYNLYTLYLLACQVSLTVGNSGLCCCVPCVWSVEFGMQLCGQPWRSTTSAQTLSQSSKTSIARPQVPSSSTAA